MLSTKGKVLSKWALPIISQSLMVLLAGILGNFIGAALVAGGIFYRNLLKWKGVLIVPLLLLIFILADNRLGTIDFFKPLRFATIGIICVLFIKQLIRKNNIAFGILLFSTYALIITMIFSPTFGAESILRSLGYFTIAFLFIDVVGKIYLNYPAIVSSAILDFLLIFIATSLIFYFSPLNGYTSSFGRFQGWLGNPNGMALFGIVSYPLVDYLRTHSIVKSKRWFTMLKLLILGSLILSGSRGGLISLSVYWFSKQFINTSAKLILALLILPVLIVFAMNISWIEIVQSLGLSDYLRLETLMDASGRSEVWAVVWEEIKQEPWFGKGMLYDQYFVDQYREQHFYAITYPPRHWYGVWSSYLSMLMNVGVIGFILYLSFLFQLYRYSYDKVRAGAFLLSILVAGIAESWMAASMNFFTPMVFMYFAFQIADRKLRQS